MTPCIWCDRDDCSYWNSPSPTTAQRWECHTACSHRYHNAITIVWRTRIVALLLLAAVCYLLAGCSTPPADAGIDPNTCQVIVYPPGALPVTWTCTSGTATTPPRQPCVEHRGYPASSDGAVYNVPTCAQCTPAELIRLDPTARCTPLGEPEAPSWAAPDMAGQPIQPPA